MSIYLIIDFDCVDSITHHKALLENLKCEKPENLSTAVLSVLRSRAFFDDVYALAFTLRPIKQSISVLESQSCTLADFSWTYKTWSCN
ncbi:hypothetical protein RhiirC2_789410 [Rhizophagus irregularis]|uniref:Uncharacterized protein n=1 Tax=Rhizophagus irregularis TaxID=588596 RepID=A0A2N1MN74_9GLOM|nr:hypothetical protein RhiirC2_789410 [Rhizophagus irregularis]